LDEEPFIGKGFVGDLHGQVPRPLKRHSNPRGNQEPLPFELGQEPRQRGEPARCGRREPLTLTRNDASSKGFEVPGPQNERGAVRCRRWRTRR
jgi:hypothetical protein